MMWKKIKEATKTETHTGLRPLSEWEQFLYETFAFYARSRQELPRLEKWNFEALFKNFAASSSELSGRLEKIRDSFFEVRRRELSVGRLQLAEIRSLLWNSIDQICALLASQKDQSSEMDKIKHKLETALHRDDLNTARKSINEVLTTLIAISQSQSSRIAVLQAQFKGQIENLQTELQSVQKELQLDGLTQVYNRATFDQHLKKVAQIAFLTGEPSTLIMFDIDHFKKVNDTYGHPAGDAVIQTFAKTIVQAFPRRTDFVARFGGEEFVVILQGTGEVPARELVSKCLVKVRGLQVSHGQSQISFSASAGLAAYQAGESFERWLERSDKALYEAKRLGRDRLILAS